MFLHSLISLLLRDIHGYEIAHIIQEHLQWVSIGSEKRYDVYEFPFIADN